MINSDRIKRDVIVLGASAGGMEGLMYLFKELPADFPAVVAVVIHRSPMYNLNLAKVLRRRSSLPVIEPDHGTIVKPGIIYLAPRDHHMLLDGDRIDVNRGPREHFTRPAIDPLFISVAKAHGKRVVGVLLSGGGDDGVSGLIAIKDAHGLVVVQDPDEAKVPSMPLSAMIYDHVDLVLPLAEIAPALTEFVAGKSVPRPNPHANR